MNKTNQKPIPKASALDRQSRLLLVFMVIVGYIVTFATIFGQDGSTISSLELLLGISFGVIYLLLGLNDRLIYDHIPAGWADGLFFSVQCLLVFGIGLLLGTSGSMFIGVPLAVFAVERLAPRQRWLVYVSLIAAVILPVGLSSGNWINALFNGITASTAVFFVAVFAQLRLNEQQSRERAEQLMADLEAANLQLAAYATQAEELAMTQERNRLAREIHDNIGHYLTVVNVQIEVAKTVMDSNPSRAFDALNKAQELAKKGLSRVRESVAALRESPISNRPLNEALASLISETQDTGIVTEFKTAGKPISLDNRVSLALFRVAQEGLTNVRRHSRASRVDMLLDYHPNEVQLIIKDNGVGATETSGGFGLLGMRERMVLVNGRLEISTGLGKGFCLTASAPITNGDQLVEPKE